MSKRGGIEGVGKPGTQGVRPEVEAKLKDRAIRLGLPLKCWISGILHRPHWWSAGNWMIQEAHIGSGSGQMKREKDARAVVMLCPIVHAVHVADRKKLTHMPVCGRTLPTVDAKNLLWVKRKFDPEGYDREYLQKVWRQVLPEPEEPDWFWLDISDSGIWA